MRIPREHWLTVLSNFWLWLGWTSQFRTLLFKRGDCMVTGVQHYPLDRTGFGRRVASTPGLLTIELTLPKLASRPSKRLPFRQVPPHSASPSCAFLFNKALMVRQSQKTPLLVLFGLPVPFTLRHGGLYVNTHAENAEHFSLLSTASQKTFLCACAFYFLCFTQLERRRDQA